MPVRWNALCAARSLSWMPGQAIALPMRYDSALITVKRPAAGTSGRPVLIMVKSPPPALRRDLAGPPDAKSGGHLTMTDEWIRPPLRPPLAGRERFAGLDATVTDCWRFALSDLC